MTPSAKAACLRVVPSLKAFLATALRVGGNTYQIEGHVSRCKLANTLFGMQRPLQHLALHADLHCYLRAIVVADVRVEGCDQHQAVL